MNSTEQASTYFVVAEAAMFRMVGFSQDAKVLIARQLDFVPHEHPSARTK